VQAIDLSTIDLTSQELLKFRLQPISHYKSLTMPLRDDVTEYMLLATKISHQGDAVASEESKFNKLKERKQSGNLVPEDIDELNAHKTLIRNLQNEMRIPGERFEELKNSIKEQLEVVDVPFVEIKIPGQGYYVITMMNDQLRIDPQGYTPNTKSTILRSLKQTF
jgi:hypothetical protein